MSSLHLKMSYLRARDPSLCPSIPMPTIIPEQFEDIDEEETPSNLDVYLRIKYTEENEIYYYTEDTLTCYVPEDSQTGRNIKNGQHLLRNYSFTKIFPEDTHQIQLFDSVVKKKVLKFINGRNTNLLTYGPSGSGKTFTIVGTRDAPGMIPQSLEYLFRSIGNLMAKPVSKPMHGHMGLIWLNTEERNNEVNVLRTLLNSSNKQAELVKHMQTYDDMRKHLSKESVALVDDLGSNEVYYSIWISFAEIYNESVYDLLEVPTGTQRKKLRVYNNNGETYIKGLQQVYVCNGNDAYCTLQHGLMNLQYAATTINAHSSRSHCIFTISLVQSSKTESANYIISRINFCDLAGSERSKKTNNIGSRLNESNNINTSLLVLGRCISAIRKAQKTANPRLQIPFRESKLTQLFHKALMGDEDISMIVAINPKKSMFDETIHALNFSAVAKDILLNNASLVSFEPASTLNSEFSITEYERQIDILQTQVQDLTAELCDTRQSRDEEIEDVRKGLLAQFKIRIEENFKKHDEELDLKDKIIERLQESLEKYLEDASDPDSSVISISSSEANTSFRESIAKSKEYHKLALQYDTLKRDNDLLKLKVEELTNVNQNQLKRIECNELKIKMQEELLQRQKLDIIRLEEENVCLDNEVIQSIRYSNIIVTEFEENAFNSTESDEM